MTFNFCKDSICKIGDEVSERMSLKYYQVVDTVFFIDSPHFEDMIVHSQGNGIISFTPYHSRGNKLEEDIEVQFGCDFKRL